MQLLSGGAVLFYLLQRTFVVYSKLPECQREDSFPHGVYTPLLGTCLGSTQRLTSICGNARRPRNINHLGVTLKALVKTQPSRTVLLSTHSRGHVDKNPVSLREQTSLLCVLLKSSQITCF